MTTAVYIQPQIPVLDLLDDDCPSREIPRHDSAAVAPDAGLFQAALYGPLRDFLSRPGKEFRSQLVEISWRLCGGHGALPRELGSVVEALHAGSLIVDDIEDESATRRGLPALHVTYGLPVALNAGNWLYFWAYRLVAQLELEPAVELGLYRRLTHTMLRCHQGQALDLTVRMSRLAQSEVSVVVETTTRLKTGTLMGLSAVLPALTLRAPEPVLASLQRFGESLGVGLQMLDDLGGLTSERRCHKGHEDLIHGRPSWPWAWLAEQLPEIDYQRLQQLARQVETRDLHPELLAKRLRKALGPHAKRRVWQHLTHAQRALPSDLPGRNGVQQLQQVLEQLVRSYD